MRAGHRLHGKRVERLRLTAAHQAALEERIREEQASTAEVDKAHEQQRSWRVAFADAERQAYLEAAQRAEWDRIDQERRDLAERTRQSESERAARRAFWTIFDARDLLNAGYRLAAVIDKTGYSEDEIRRALDLDLSTVVIDPSTTSTGSQAPDRKE